MRDSVYLSTMRERVLIYDGAMGTEIQDLELSASDFGGEKLLGCNDHLSLTRPDVIQEIHASFLDVGCDVIETNTFRANRLSIAEYGLEDQIGELNRAAAQLARTVVDDYFAISSQSYIKLNGFCTQLLCKFE